MVLSNKEEPLVLSTEVKKENKNNKILSPAVRKIVEEKKIDIKKIKGTGKDGRITKQDVVVALDKVEADGVHLGLNDMHISRARDLLGETKLIGYTIHSYQEITPNIIEV